MAQILHYFVWRTAVDVLPSADSKSISEPAVSFSQGGHIQQIMVNTTDDSLEFKGVCQSEMKKKVQYSIALIITRATSASTHAVCWYPAGEGAASNMQAHWCLLLYARRILQIGKTRPVHLRKTDTHEIEQLRCDLLQTGSNCGLLQVPVSTKIALQDHSYTAQST